MGLRSLIVGFAISLSFADLLAQTGSGDFVYSHNVDAITGEDHSQIVVFSDDWESGLAWRCDATRLQVAIATGFMTGENDQITLTWRVGRDRMPGRLCQRT